MQINRNRVIRYHAQPKNSRECGAAAAAMILLTNRKIANAKTIWKQIQSLNHHGQPFIKTISYAHYLISRKFKVVVVRAKDPISILDLAFANNIDATLVCRPDEESDVGHFMVLVSTDTNSVVVHDPADKPFRVINKNDLKNLFTPLTPHSESKERILVLSSLNDISDHICSICSQNFHQGTVVQCNHCRNNVEIAFPAIIGCVNASCAGSNIDAIFCPECDSSLRIQ